VNERKNLNIALTGRYGTGKSSVLDEFVSQNKATTMPVAISTLGPDTDGCRVAPPVTYRSSATCTFLRCLTVMSL
jgi:hypothetical protein